MSFFTRLMLAAAIPCVLANPLAAQDDVYSSFYIEALGNSAAFEDANASLNYDVAFPSGLGVRLGASTDMERMSSGESFVLLGTFNYFFGMDLGHVELGIGPMLRIAGDTELAVASTLGFRLQPIFDRWMVRVSYAPTVTADGYRGYPGLSVGMLIDNE